MLKKFFYIVLFFFSVSINSTSAEQDKAQFRFMQLSFVPQVSATVDVQMDGVTIFEAVTFPFATDYLEVAAGEHSLVTQIIDVDDATADTVITLEAGHRYSVIVEGDYSADEVTFILVDETDLIPEQVNTGAIVANLTPDVLDVVINDEVIVADIAVGTYAFVQVPDTEFIGAVTLAGEPEEVLFSDNFEPFPNIMLLGVIRQDTSGDFQTIIHRWSDLTIKEFLRDSVDNPDFSTIAGLLVETDLVDSLANDEAYTLFLPTNDLLSELSDLAIPSDSDLLRNLLLQHVVVGNIPPTVLPQHQTLTSLAGNILNLNFGQTDSGYWEVEGAPIWWDIRLANGVIYGIGDVISP